MAVELYETVDVVVLIFTPDILLRYKFLIIVYKFTPFVQGKFLGNAVLTVFLMMIYFN